MYGGGYRFSVICYGIGRSFFILDCVVWWEFFISCGLLGCFVLVVEGAGF